MDTSISPTAVAPLPADKGQVNAPSSAATDEGPSPVLVQSSAPAVTFPTPSDQPKVTDPSKSSVIAQDTNRTDYKNPDGSITREVSPTPLNVQRSDGSWVAAKTAVKQDLMTGAISAADNPLTPTFARSLGSGADVSVNSGSDPISMSLSGAAASKGTLPSAPSLHSADGGLGSNSSAAASSVVYPGVFPGEDLQYQVTTSEVKETLVLNSVPSADESAWSWIVHAPGLTMSASDRSSINLTDLKRVVQYNIPDPIMWDSSGVAEKSEPALVDVPFTFSQLADGDWQITVTPDRTWLTDPARVYPVSVDPTLGIGPTPYTAYESNGTTIASQIRTGNSRDGGDTYWRTVVYYEYNNFEGTTPALGWADEIMPNSYFATQYVAGTANIYIGNIYQASVWGFSAPMLPLLTQWAIGTADVYNGQSGVSSFYQGCINAGTDGCTVAFTGNEAAGVYTYKHVNSQLYLNYEAAPTVTAVSPVGGVHASIMPTLSVSSTNPAGGPDNYSFEVSTNSNPDVSPIWTSNGFTTSSPYMQVPINTLAPATTYYWKASIVDQYGAIRSTTVNSFITNTPGSISSTGSLPTDQSVLATLTPTLSVPTAGSIPGGGTPHYQFRLTTGTDGISGQVVSSPVMTFPGSGPMTWTVPAGVLQDGTTYTWTVLVEDGIDNYWSWVNHFKVNMRVTNSGPAPTDLAGPVTVNLANGNVSAAFTSPTVSALGGAMGMSFNYNSQAPGNAGLTGAYYNAIATGTTTPVFTFPPTTPVILQRTDTQVNFSWGTSSPGPNVPSQNVLGVWTGYITPPAAGTYTLGFTGSDTATVYLGGSTTAAASMTAANTTTSPTMGSAISLPAGPTAIRVQYTNGTDTPSLAMWVNYSGLSGPEIVPATWFTKTVAALPGGWSGSQPIGGDAATFVSEQSNNGSIVFTDTTGATHTYTLSAAAGAGYLPPPGESGVVSVISGVVNFTDDSEAVSVFNAAGQLVSATSPVDASKPAAAVPSYNGNGQLASLSDPLSSNGATPAVYGRQVVFTYSNATTQTGVCAAPTGFSAPPIGVLCEISYPDSSTEMLYYDVNGQLARVVDPGSEVTDFGYTQLNGVYLLSAIRNSLANDWIAASPGTRSTSNPVATTISYDAFGRASTVTLPASDGVTTTTEPAKIYAYSSSNATPPAPGSNGTATVSITGLGTSGNLARTVTFNSSLQGIKSVDAMGLESDQTWDSSDDPLTSISPQGIETSTVYDWQNRPTDNYGPGPTACFSGNLPVSLSAPCNLAGGGTRKLGHSSTSYDGGAALQGLNAVYYSNTSFAGSPSAFGMIPGPINVAYDAATPPATGVPATNFSLQLTGTITFPTAGTYTITANGGTNVYVADLLTVNGIGSTIAHSGTFSAAAGQTVRIRVLFQAFDIPSTLTLAWTPPGGSSTPIPAANLSPDYSLVTATHTDDGTAATGAANSQVPAGNTAISYGSTPWLGQVASAGVDPTGLNITSTATYETGTTGYDRQLTSVKPAGSGTTTTNAYYAATDTAGANVGASGSNCVASGTIQYGMLKSSTGPTNSSGVALVTKYVYDSLGRVVGTLRPGNTVWTCVTYDSRGRVTQTVISDSSYSGGSRTITNTYTTAGDPLTTSVQDNGVPGATGVTASPTSGKITTVSDLLGRTTSYTDVWNTVTTSSYNRLSQLTGQVSTPTGQPTKNENWAYNFDGQVTSVQKQGLTIAQVTYNAVGQMATVSNPTGTGNNGNGVTGTYTYDPNTGAQTGLTWAFPASQPSVSDAEILSQAGRVMQDTITDNGVGAQSTYTYDAAGRLVTAVIPNHTLTYGFGSSTLTPCGSTSPSSTAGADGNRTSYSDVMTASKTCTTYGYDNADRLTSDTVTTPVTGADPIAGTSLTSTGATPNLVYDARGNITALADQTMTYDQSNRHMSTTTGTTSVVYQRDADDRIVSAATTISGTTTVAYYSFNDDGSAADWTFTAIGSGLVADHTFALPGGVTMDPQNANSTVAWSYPDLHGDDIVTTDASGNRVGALAQYDPFGNPIDPTSHLIGSKTSDDAVPNNTKNSTTQSFGWKGSAGKLYQHTSDIATIEMGARQYVSLIGRFLSVDPVLGGNANGYNYPNDPVDGQDLSGRIGICDCGGGEGDDVFEVSPDESGGDEGRGEGDDDMSGTEGQELDRQYEQLKEDEFADDAAHEIANNDHSWDKHQGDPEFVFNGIHTKAQYSNEIARTVRPANLRAGNGKSNSTYTNPRTGFTVHWDPQTGEGSAYFPGSPRSSNRLR